MQHEPKHPLRRSPSSAAILGVRVAVALPVVLLVVGFAPPTAAQPFQGGSQLSSRLALKVLLSSEDALSAGRFDADSVEFETQQLGIRFRLGDGEAKPFVGAFAGRYDEERRGQRRLQSFEATTVGVEAGADVPLGTSTHDAGWFFEPRAALGYSWADSPQPGAREAEAEALTVLGSATFGHRWQHPGGWRWELGAGLWALHSDPTSADPELDEGSVSSAHLRFHAAALRTLAASLADRPLELRAAWVHTEVDSEIGDPLGIERLDEVSLSLLIRVGDGQLPVDAVGLAFRYFDADSFDGWTVGITVSD